MTHETTYKAEYHRRWLRTTAVTLFALILITIFLIATGIFDPNTKDTTEIAISPTTLTISPQSRQTIWQTSLPTPPYTIKLKAALQSGEVDSGYGFVLGDESAHFGVAVAPTGYLTVWQTGDQNGTILPWQTWPHVQTGNASNEIWLDLTAEGLATLRINRELLWSGNIDIPVGEFGLYGESFGETAVINYQTP